MADDNKIVIVDRRTDVSRSCGRNISPEIQRQMRLILLEASLGGIADQVAFGEMSDPPMIEPIKSATFSDSTSTFGGFRSKKDRRFK